MSPLADAADFSLARTAAEDLEAGGFTARATAVSACVRSAQVTAELLVALRTLTAVYEDERSLIEQPCHPESALGIARAAIAAAEKQP